MPSESAERGEEQAEEQAEETAARKVEIVRAVLHSSAPAKDAAVTSAAKHAKAKKNGVPHWRNAVLNLDLAIILWR